MGSKTGIAWTDSTFNSWHGCLKVSDACTNCYAEAVDKRGGGSHWGAGVPRRRISEHTRNEPYRWNRTADKFEAEHGRRRRAFTLSMGDLFDNEVPDDWRDEHMQTMEDCDRIDWQICTKRIGNVVKMVPDRWRGVVSTIEISDGLVVAAKTLRGMTDPGWPRHIGLMITVIDQKEADRDIPKLLDLKRSLQIPWVGISYEPALGPIDFSKFVGLTTFYGDVINARHKAGTYLDWIICGGESGAGWRPMDLQWARDVRDQCSWTDTAFFFKQVAAFRPKDDDIPPDLRIRQFPEWER